MQRQLFYTCALSILICGLGSGCVPQNACDHDSADASCNETAEDDPDGDSCTCSSNDDDTSSNGNTSNGDTGDASNGNTSNGNTSNGTTGNTSNGTTGTTSNGTTGTTSNGTTGNTSNGTTGNTDPIWTSYAHPCTGNRTDALLVEDNDRIWLGCGSTTTGYGLHTTADYTNWNTLLETWRVLEVQRSEDGWLYVAGLDTEGRDGVVRLDTSTDPIAVESVWTRGGTASTSFTVDGFARKSTGETIAEDFTGTDLAWRASDDSQWQHMPSADWCSNGFGGGMQMLDLRMHNDTFYGVGSRISQPPVFFYEQEGSDSISFRAVVLDEEQQGELWGLAVDGPEDIVAVGVDQRDNIGVIYRSVGPPSTTANWEVLRVDTWVTGRSWMRGACMKGDTIVALGEKQPLRGGNGIILISTDGGETYQQHSPRGVGDTVSECHIKPDGTIIVTGSGGFMAVYGN